MDSIRHNLLDLLGQSLSQSLGHDRVASGVRDFARLWVGARVVGGVGDLVFDGFGDLIKKMG
jgi:hypothetical protein